MENIRYYGWILFATVSSRFRLRLADILVRPMQRLTKYNLLLCAIRKHISEDTETEITDAMVKRFSIFLRISMTISNNSTPHYHRSCGKPHCIHGMFSRVCVNMFGSNILRRKMNAYTCTTLYHHKPQAACHSWRSINQNDFHEPSLALFTF